MNQEWEPINIGIYGIEILGFIVFTKDFFGGFLHPSFNGKVNGEIGNPQFAEMPSLGLSGT